MRRRTALVLLLAALSVGSSWAQTAQQSGQQSASPAGGPGEPEIVMPQVVLQIEDLSVEKVEAQLPPEDDLLPPERTVPVLSEGELAVGEPSIPGPGIDTEPVGTPASNRFLSSEVNLGTGTLNNIVGSVSLKTLGADPRFSLQFAHETMDGFSRGGISTYQPGSGYSLRTDDLNGGLKFRLGPVDTDLSGAFAERETGLQGQAAAYTAALSRTLNATASFSATPLDWLSLNGAVGGTYDSLTLEGGTPLQLMGASVSPSLSADARFGNVTFGLSTGYTYRSDTASPVPDLHRFTADATFGLSLPATFLVDGSAGWFWNSAGLSLFPFSLLVTGTPFEFFTMSLGGGYKVVPYDIGDILAASSFALPAGISDDRGWYGDASVQLAFTRDLAVTTKVSFMASEALPVGSRTQDPTTGLFTMTQGAHNELSTDLGLRWGITQAFSLSAKWTHQYLDTAFFSTSDSFSAELLGLDSAGRFGGSISVLVAPTVTQVLQQPVLRMSGFWKVADSVKLQLEGDDLLQPLTGTSRLDIPPYVSPGFRIIASLSMSL
jgi:hypothetical protein